MNQNDFLFKAKKIFESNKIKSQYSEQDFMVKDINIKIYKIPKSIFLVIKKYGWVVFFHKLINFGRLTKEKYFGKIKKFYGEMIFSYKRDGLKKMLIRSMNFIFYGKGVLSKAELFQRKIALNSKSNQFSEEKLQKINHFLSEGKEFIVVISHDASRTGAPLLALNITKTLVSDFGKKVIAVLFWGGPLEKEFEKWSIVVKLSHQSLTSMEYQEQQVADQLFEKLSRIGVKKCICNTVLSGSLAPILKKHQFSTIGLVHEMSETIKEHNFIDATEKLLRYSDQLVFSSDFVKNDFAKNFENFEREIFIRPQGIYLKNNFEDEKVLARKILRRRLGLDQEAKIILGAGFGHLRKGADLFFEVAGQVTKEVRDLGVYFVWMGDWDESLRDELLKKAEEGGFSDRILLVDFENDPSLFFAGADIFLLPSRQDPFPSVVLEAMNCSLPVIVFDKAGGSPEILIGGQGVVVPYLDVMAMKNETICLLKDDKYYEFVSNKAKEAVDKKFFFKDYVKFLLERLESKNEVKKKQLISSAENQNLEVSIVFLTYNGLKDHFEETLEMVRRQKTNNKFEIIAIDSGSKDGTVEFIKKQKDIRLYEIPNSDFGHGKTRQLGAELAKGDLVVFLTQDATPANDFWLKNLLDNFVDRDVVGVCSRVIPRKEACLLKKIEVNNDLSGRTKKIIAEIKNKDEFQKLNFQKKRSDYYFFNDVSSCIRRSYLMENPFPDVPFAEDVEFAKIALNHGKKIVFEPRSVVYHSHDYSVVKTYKRNYVDAEYHREYLKKITVPTYKKVLKNTIFSIIRDLVEFKKYKTSLVVKFFSLLYSPIIHLAEQLGQLDGATQRKRLSFMKENFFSLWKKIIKF